jgi:hypothetical protein
LSKINLFRKKQTLPQNSHTLVYHHLGLGDYLIISGGIKYLKALGEIGPAFCICMDRYLFSVKQLYSDVDNFGVISVNDYAAADIVVKHWKGNVIKIGFDKMQDFEHFDIDFYRMLNVPFNERWDSFTIKRNYEAEKKLIEKLNLPEKFVFVHDDASRGFVISDQYMKMNLPVIRPFITNSIFDWIGVLERATEIHCICSSFKHLVDSVPGINAKLYYHWGHVNKGKPREASITVSKKDWKVI